MRAGDRRFRVVGILGERGESLGMDFAEMLIIPVASAQALFNSEGCRGCLSRCMVRAFSTVASS